MDKDSEFGKVQKWFEFTNGPLDHELACSYLIDKIEKIFECSRPGVPLSSVPQFLSDNNLTEEMVRAVGFQTMPHFLFHLEHILEIREKKINGRIVYFLFGRRSRLDSSYQKRDNNEMEVYHVNTSPVADFHKILNLYRNFVVPSSGLTDFSVKVRGKLEREQAKLARTRNVKKLETKKTVSLPRRQ
ncbi:unnamed protein product [Allacma fusca]|uniref:Uncharacterized protein n=1 Tax=Allacma fusca TaxID=39272 RepID=A0A8J2K443_9HEXA|nr:unnamed protein product [Allacma fusca]